MRKRFLMLAIAPAVLLFGGSQALAQTASDSISVSARNVGIFQFDITNASFDFGDVDAAGTLSTTGVAGVRNGADDGALYTATGATTFTCSSAPSRTVRVYNASTTSTIGWGVADRLSMQIPTTGLPGSTSCGYLAFSTTGDGGAGTCAGGALVHTVTAGNGANSASGSVDFQLEVLDVDGPGTNTWTVVLTAVGA